MIYSELSLKGGIINLSTRVWDELSSDGLRSSQRRICARRLPALRACVAPSLAPGRALLRFLAETPPPWNKHPRSHLSLGILHSSPTLSDVKVMRSRTYTHAGTHRTAGRLTSLHGVKVGGGGGRRFLGLCAHIRCAVCGGPLPPYKYSRLPPPPPGPLRGPDAPKRRIIQKRLRACTSSSRTE